ncbi:MAG: ATP-binding protein [Proteobacteria bacterium]|jgi:signal transduction histidine kinase|nr:ATP-binding protein [Pseudomonadota bacterium]
MKFYFQEQKNIYLYRESLKKHVLAGPGLLFAITGVFLFSPAQSIFLYIGGGFVLLSLILRGYFYFANRSLFQTETVFNERSEGHRLFRWWFLISLSSGLGWFFSSLFYVLTYEPFSHEVFFITLVVAGIAASALHSVSINLPTYITYLALLTSPLLTSFYLHENWALLTMCLLFVGYLFVYAFVFRNAQISLEKKHRESVSQQSYYKSVIDSVPALVTILDQELKYRLINSSVSQYLGTQDKDIMGKPVGFLKNQEFYTMIKNFQESAFQIKQINTKLALPGEEPRWYLTVMNKIPQSSEIIIVSFDVHDRYMAEQKNLEQRAVIEGSARMAAIGQVTAGIAHEINNPLAVIIGKAQLLRRRWEKLKAEDVHAELERIERTSFRISKIIKGLRALSRDGEKDAFVDTPIETLTQDVATMFEEKLKNFGIQLEVSIPKDLSMECQHVQIGQVILNLVSNSIDAIKEREEKWIKVSALDLMDVIEISVMDSGPGIPGEVADKLMTPFFTTKPAGQGTGLGLSISRRILADHGGELRLDRNSNHTRFVLVIPKKQKSSLSA